MAISWRFKVGNVILVRTNRHRSQGRGTTVKRWSSCLRASPAERRCRGAASRRAWHWGVLLLRVRCFFRLTPPVLLAASRLGRVRGRVLCLLTGVAQAKGVAWVEHSLPVSPPAPDGGGRDWTAAGAVLARGRPGRSPSHAARLRPASSPSERDTGELAAEPRLRRVAAQGV